jgi:hypothetical protein
MAAENIVWDEPKEAIAWDTGKTLSGRTGGTIMNSDVPTVITNQNRGSIPPASPSYSMADKVKALYEVPATIGSAMISQPASMLYGAGRSVVEGAMKGQAPSSKAMDEYYRQGVQATQFRPTSPVSVGALESLGSTMDELKLPPMIPTTGMLPSYARSLRASAPVLNEGLEVAQAVGQNISPVARNMATALRGEPKMNIGAIAKTAPSAETLANKADTAFKSAEQAGVLFKPEQFVQKMTDIGSELRSKGYTPNAYPMVTDALKELQNPTLPKDFAELQALREMISGAQSSNISKERRLATILKNKFDEYVTSAPESSVSIGSKEGAEAWKEGRDVWSKLAKSENFTNMIDKAELNESKKSVDMYLRDKMLTLASNDDKMRMFTPEEQKAIRQVAEGSGTQNMLSALGKTSLRNILGTGAGSLIGFALGGPVGAAVAPAITAGSKYAASKMRKSEIDKLAAYLRAGGKGAENE